MRACLTAAFLLSLAAAPAWAAKATITVNAITPEGIGQNVGTIEAVDSAKGLVLKPDLKGLPTGPHGIHVHQNGDCGPAVQDGKPVAGLAAGGHFDPHQTGAHKGPWGEGGHMGDLPALSVNGDGSATDPLIAPHLKLSEIRGKAIIIHAGPDNYADAPKPLGGGGGRIACGVIK